MRLGQLGVVGSGGLRSLSILLYIFSCVLYGVLFYSGFSILLVLRSVGPFASVQWR